MACVAAAHATWIPKEAEPQPPPSSFSAVATTRPLPATNGAHPHPSAPSSPPGRNIDAELFRRACEHPDSFLD